MRAARAGEESREPGRCGIEAGDPERKAGGSVSWRLIRQQQAAKERWSLSRQGQGEAWFKRFRLRDDRLSLRRPARNTY
jgi:hypothetical protein